ncbi:hypothetical protein JCM14036_11250 [Desulfotomaculum defluvii]
MDTSFAKWVHQYIHVVFQHAQKELRYHKEYQKDQSKQLKGRRLWGRLSKFENHVSYMKQINSESWSSLHSNAKEEISDHLHALGELSAKQVTVTELYNDFPDLRFAFGKAVAPSSRPNWTQERQRIYQLAEEKGLDKEKIETGLKYLDTYDPKKELKNIEGIVVNMYERLHLDWLRRTGALMGSRFAELVASFNLVSTPTPDSSLLPSLPAEISKKLTIINQVETEIWLSLKSKEGKTILQEKIRLLKEQTEEDIHSFTIPRLDLIASLRKENPQDPSLGNLAIEIADLARRQLQAQALADTLNWALDLEGKVLKEWIKAAQAATCYETKYQWPQPVPIDTLLASPQRYEGQDVVIEGLVKEVKIEHKGKERKVISTALVAGDTSNITVSLPFIKLDSGGLVPGAWCRLAGTWKGSSKDALGEPALEIDRIPYTKLGKESFRDWLTNQIAPIFLRIPHEIAGTWSWQKGSNGAANPLKYGVWCRHERSSKRGRR